MPPDHARCVREGAVEYGKAVVRQRAEQMGYDDGKQGFDPLCLEEPDFPDFCIDDYLAGWRLGHDEHEKKQRRVKVHLKLLAKTGVEVDAATAAVRLARA